MRTELDIRDDQFLLLFVGNGLRSKGARYALETAAISDEKSVLLVVGADCQNFLTDPKAVLPGLREQGRIQFSDTKKEIWKYYAAADALIFPSLTESFGLVVLEAMACGLPVITARTVALGDEHITNGHNGFVVDWPWDTDDMSKHVNRLISDQKLYALVSVNARKTAEEFTWDKHVDAMKSVYKNMIEKQSSTGFVEKNI